MKIKTHWVSLASLTTVAFLLALPSSAMAQTTDDPAGRFFIAQMPAFIPPTQLIAPKDGSPEQAPGGTKVERAAGVPWLSALEPTRGLIDRDSPGTQQLADANVAHTNLLTLPIAAYVAPQRPVPKASEPRIQWASVAKQSLFFLAIQHSFRFATEPGTRAELKGPFFKDWGNSILGYDGWRDGDPAIVNYVGHPMMGSISGFIEIQNDRDGKGLTFGSSSAYWKSRGRAMAFSAVYSALFEIGPLSEASLGNVGLDPKTSGMVDLVVTPTIGTAWLIAEDIIDRYVIAKLEGKIGNRPAKIFMRGFLNPSRSFTNMLAGKEPWLRHNRGGLWYNQP